MYCGDDVEAVVGDVGTSRAKFGLAGEDTPTHVLPTLVGRKQYSQQRPISTGGASPTATDATPSSPDSAFVVGDLHHARSVDVLQPIQAGAVADWDALEQIWHHAFERLHVVPSEHPVITATASCHASDALQRAASRDTEKYAEMMFETFNVPAFYMARDAVLDAFAFGRSAALIVELGAGSTRVVPVYDGFHLQRPAQHSSIGCNALSAHLEQLVSAKYPALDVRPRGSFTRRVNAHGKLETLALSTTAPSIMSSSHLAWTKADIFRDMRETLCAVAPTADSIADGAPQQQYELPDGTVVTLGRECWDVGELLLHAALPKNPITSASTADSSSHTSEAPAAAAIPTAATPTTAKGLHTMLYDAVHLCDADVRRDMLSNIILCGGGSLMRGLTERLHAELTAIVPSSFKVRFTTGMKVERQFSTFIGGSILASLGSFQQLWVSRQEYDEVGAHAICAQRFT